MMQTKTNMDENKEENAETPVKNDLSAAEMRAFERQTEVRLVCMHCMHIPAFVSLCMYIYHTFLGHSTRLGHDLWRCQL